VRDAAHTTVNKKRLAACGLPVLSSSIKNEKKNDHHHDMSCRQHISCGRFIFYFGQFESPPQWFYTVISTA
jgi:hypothetical protein